MHEYQGDSRKPPEPPLPTPLLSSILPLSYLAVFLYYLRYSSSIISNDLYLPHQQSSYAISSILPQSYLVIFLCPLYYSFSEYSSSVISSILLVFFLSHNIILPLVFFLCHIQYSSSVISSKLAYLVVNRPLSIYSDS